MDGVHDTERLPVYHDPELGAIVAELWPGGPPRLFALVYEGDDENDQIVREVMAYGIALPNGSAATVGAAGSGWGRWRSACSASRRTGSDLVWLSP
jgi:hypothetical protein